MTREALANAVRQLALPGGTILAAISLLTYIALRAKHRSSK